MWVIKDKLELVKQFKVNITPFEGFLLQFCQSALTQIRPMATITQKLFKSILTKNI